MTTTKIAMVEGVRLDRQMAVARAWYQGTSTLIETATIERQIRKGQKATPNKGWIYDMGRLTLAG